MKKTILIADDEPNIRLLVKSTLPGEEYEVVEAADGQEALQRIRATRLDLVILDLMMPRCTGIEVLRELQAHPPTPKPSIIVLTAKVHEEEKARKFGVMHYLHKPFSPLELLGVIERTLVERAA
ncbi:MAG: response regulator [Nitrospirae bacterium]|nr:response regulator [Nitrospirota bacterium]